MAFQRNYGRNQGRPIGASEYSFSQGSSDYRQDGPVYPHNTFAEQPASYHTNNERPMTGQLTIPPRHYTQTLEEEFALARRRNQEYETTILQLANLLCQAPFGGNHNLNPGIAQAFAHPQYPNPSPQPQPPFASRSGVQDENTAMSPPPDYSEHDQFQLPPTTTFPRIARVSPSYPPISPGNAPRISTPSPRPPPRLNIPSTSIGFRSEKTPEYNQGPVIPTPSSHSSVGSPSEITVEPNPGPPPSTIRNSKGYRSERSVDYNPSPINSVPPLRPNPPSVRSPSEKTARSVEYNPVPSPSRPNTNFPHPTSTGYRSEKSVNSSTTNSVSPSRPNPPSSHPTSMGYRSEKSVGYNPSPIHSVPPSRPNPPSSHPTPRSEMAGLFFEHSRKPEWFVEYDRVADRALDVNLVRTITNDQGAFRIKFSPNGQFLAVVACKGQIVTIYNVASGAKVCKLEDLYERQDPPSTQDLSFSYNGKYLATCTEDPENIIRIWDVCKKFVRNVLKGHLHGILSVDFSPNGRLLISASSDATVRLWNMRDGSSRIFHHSTSYICSVRFSPDGRHLAAGSFNANVFLWDLRSRHLVSSMTGHTDTVSSLDFMPNGGGLISGSWDGTLRYWNCCASTSTKTNDAKRRLPFVGNSAEILSVSIQPHGQWVVSGSVDCTVGIWNTLSGAQQCLVHGHTEKVYSVHCSPAGGYFASADWKGMVRIWSYKSIQSGSMVENARLR